MFLTEKRPSLCGGPAPASLEKRKQLFYVVKAIIVSANARPVVYNTDFFVLFQTV